MLTQSRVRNVFHFILCISLQWIMSISSQMIFCGHLEHVPLLFCICHARSSAEVTLRFASSSSRRRARRSKTPSGISSLKCRLPCERKSRISRSGRQSHTLHHTYEVRLCDSSSSSGNPKRSLTWSSCAYFSLWRVVELGESRKQSNAQIRRSFFKLGKDGVIVP